MIRHVITLQLNLLQIKHAKILYQHVLLNKVGVVLQDQIVELLFKLLVLLIIWEKTAFGMAQHVLIKHVQMLWLQIKLMQVVNHI